MRLLVLVAALAALPAYAGSQLERSVASGLAQEGIAADIAALTPARITALHLELTGQSDPGEGDVRRRDAILAILAWESQ